MKKTIKKNVVITAVLAIMLCVSLIAGATFALFTSESKVNIAVTSGKVDVVANVDTDSVCTKQNGDADYIKGDSNMYQATAIFDNDGLTLSNMVPGDAIKFNIVVKNNSTVTVKYRTVIACEDNGLLDGLNITINDKPYKGTTDISDYETIEVGSKDVVVPVEIELPVLEDAINNLYQGKTLTLSYKVEAVQGNATTSNPDANTAYVYTASDMMALLTKTGVKKIEFVNDIDMSGKDWTGLNTNNFAQSGVTVIGNGHTVSNLSASFVDKTTYNVSINALTISDSKIERVRNTEGFAAFVQYADCCTITLDSCHLVDSEVKTTEDTRVGGFIGVCYGYAKVSNCTVEGCELEAFGSVGGIIAQAGDYTGGKVEINNCSVKNTILTSVDDGNWRVGAIVGSVNLGTTYVNGCTFSGNTLTQDSAANPNHELFGRIIANAGKLYVDGGEFIANGVILKGGEYQISTAEGLVYCATTYNTSNTTLNKKFVLMNDIDMEGIVWKPWCNDAQYFNGLFDGKNYEIQNLTIEDDAIALGHATGFIGRLGANGLGEKTLQNVKFVDANVSGHHWVGVAVGYNEYGYVYNVQVISSHVVNTHDKNGVISGDQIACGDKTGAVIGFVGASAADGCVNNCEAINCTVEGCHDAGQIVGAAKTAQVTNCTVGGKDGVIVSQTTQGDTCDSAGNNINNDIIGRVLQA